MGLADQVIQANEDEQRGEQELIDKRAGDKAPEGFYTDDLGFWVEQDIRRKKVKFAEYVLFRCQYLCKTLMKTDDTLYNERRVVSPTSSQIAYLADLPESISTATAIWVYKRLLEWAPKLNDKKIIVCPGLMWDLEKGELIEVTKKGKEK